MIFFLCVNNDWYKISSLLLGNTIFKDNTSIESFGTNLDRRNYWVIFWILSYLPQEMLVMEDLSCEDVDAE